MGCCRKMKDAKKKLQNSHDFKYTNCTNLQDVWKNLFIY